MKVVGILIVLIGIGLTVFTGFTFFTQEKVADIAGIEITKEKPHHVNIPFLMAIAVIGVGGVIMWKSYQKQ